MQNAELKKCFKNKQQERAYNENMRRIIEEYARANGMGQFGKLKWVGKQGEEKC